GPVVVGQMPLPFRGVGTGLERLVHRPDREREARAKCMGRAHEIAEVECLRHALGADGEIPARLRGPGLTEPSRDPLVHLSPSLAAGYAGRHQQISYTLTQLDSHTGTGGLI